jgi:hypothetical protein
MDCNKKAWQYTNTYPLLNCQLSWSGSDYVTQNCLSYHQPSTSPSAGGPAPTPDAHKPTPASNQHPNTRSAHHPQSHMMRGTGKVNVDLDVGVSKKGIDVNAKVKAGGH